VATTTPFLAGLNELDPPAYAYALEQLRR
jgi:hypothetical protein